MSFYRVHEIWHFTKPDNIRSKPANSLAFRASRPGCITLNAFEFGKYTPMESHQLTGSCIFLRQFPPILASVRGRFAGAGWFRVCGQTRGQPMGGSDCGSAAWVGLERGPGVHWRVGIQGCLQQTTFLGETRTNHSLRTILPTCDSNYVCISREAKVTRRSVAGIKILS